MRGAGHPGQALLRHGGVQRDQDATGRQRAQHGGDEPKIAFAQDGHAVPGMATIFLEQNGDEIAGPAQFRVRPVLAGSGNRHGVRGASDPGLDPVGDGNLGGRGNGNGKVRLRLWNQRQGQHRLLRRSRQEEVEHRAQVGGKFGGGEAGPGRGKLNGQAQFRPTPDTGQPKFLPWPEPWGGRGRVPQKPGPDASPRIGKRPRG